MSSKLVLFAVLALAAAAEEMKTTKRSLEGLGYPSWNSILGNPLAPHFGFPHGVFQPLAHPYPGKGGHFGLTTATADIAAAVAAAKEATAAAALAQQRVQAAKEQVVIQERVAAAKEAAAQAAIQRSEAAAQVAAAIQRSQALAAAAAAVHKSAAASAASAAAAHAAGHFTSGPWGHPKLVFNHWG